MLLTFLDKTRYVKLCLEIVWLLNVKLSPDMYVSGPSQIQKDQVCSPSVCLMPFYIRTYICMYFSYFLFKH